LGIDTDASVVGHGGRFCETGRTLFDEGLSDYAVGNTQRKVRPVSMIVKAEGPSGRAKIRSEDPKHALGLVQYLRTIGYTAWIEDTNGNEIEETALKMAIKSIQ
jgi:hypothetical protein